MALPLNIVSKYRNEVYGISILWVVIFHANAIDNVDLSFGCSTLRFLDYFLCAGSVGVDIFLFLSGICLYFSFTKCPDYKEFITKRLSRVLLPTYLIYSLYWLIRFVAINHDLVAFISRMTLMRFWITGDSTIWFVSLILVLYLLYPYIYSFLFENSHFILKSIVLIISSLVFVTIYYLSSKDLYHLFNIAITRIPIFMVGCVFGKLVYDGKTVSWIFVPVVIALFCVFIYATQQITIVSSLSRRLIYGVGGLSGCYILAIIFEAISSLGKIALRLLSMLSNLGKCSLELYCSHIMLNQVYQLSPLYVEGSPVRYIVVVIASILLSIFVYKTEVMIHQCKKRTAA